MSQSVIEEKSISSDRSGGQIYTGHGYTGAWSSNFDINPSNICRK